MSKENELIQLIETEMDLVLKKQVSMSELEIILADHINDLIKKDFLKLLSVLYRIDVSEPLLIKSLEEQTGTDGGLVIARLIIQRGIQKIESRKKSSSYPGDVEETEKW